MTHQWLLLNGCSHESGLDQSRRRREDCGLGLPEQLPARHLARGVALLLLVEKQTDVEALLVGGLAHGAPWLHILDVFNGCCPLVFRKFALTDQFYQFV